MDVFEICVSADKGTEKPKWQQQSDPVGDETVDEQLIDAIGEEIEVYYFDATKDHGR